MGNLIAEMRRNYRNKKTYMRMFVSFVLAGTALLTVVTFLIYTFFSQRMLRDIGEHSESLLQRDAENVSFLLDWTMSYAFRSSKDVNLEPYVQRDFEDSFVDYEVWTRLRNIRDNHPFIDSIALYNGYTSSFLDTTTGISGQEDYYDQSLVEFMNRKKITISHLILPREAITNETGAAVKHRWMTIVIPYDYGVSPSMFIMNVNLDSLSASISAKLAQRSDDVYLVREDGVILAGTEPSLFLQMLSGFDELKDDDGRSGWTTRDGGGYREMVIRRDVKFSSIYKWQLVEKIPVRTLLSGISSLRQLTLLVLAVSLVVIILAFWWLSKKIYTPIDHLIRKVMSSMKSRRAEMETDNEDLQLLARVFVDQDDQIKVLSEYRRNNRELAKDAFLRKLILNSPAYSGSEWQSYLEQHDIRLQPHGLWVGVVRIDCHEDFLEKYSPSDQSLLRFGIANIVKECMQGSTPEAFDMQDLVVFVMNANGTASELKEKLTEAKAAILYYLGMSTTIAVGKIVEDFKGLNQAYKEAIQLSEERFTKGQGRCFLSSADERHSPVGVAYVYPEDLEKALLGAIRESQPTIAVESLKQFLDRVRSYPHSEARLAVTHLIINLDKTWWNAPLRSAQDTSDGGLSAIDEQLNQLETLDAIEDWLTERIGIFFSDKLHLVALNGKQREVVQEICGIIDFRYADPNLSTKGLSDEIGLSTNYIRTLFKSTMHISIMDYIADKRLEHACQLLRTSSLSVEEIAERVGFTAVSSFYTGFKKRYLITPNQYRKDAEAYV